MQATHSVSPTVTPQMQQNYRETVVKLMSSALVELGLRINELVAQKQKEQKPLLFTKEEILQKYSRAHFLETFLKNGKPIQVQIYNNVVSRICDALDKGRNDGNATKIIEETEKCHIFQSDIVKRIVVDNIIANIQQSKKTK